MAHFAKMTEDGTTVLGVHVVADADCTDDSGNETEAQGTTFLNKIHNWTYWRKTSYNTSKGVHKLGGTPYRKNYAGIGMLYDSERDAFRHPSPYPSWVLNESSCWWEAPVAYPDDGKVYEWNESSETWVMIQE